MNQQEKLLEFKTLTQSLSTQSNSTKDHLLKGTLLKSHSEKLSELLKVDNFNQSNFLKLMNNLRLEFQIKILSNKRLELLMVEDLCQLNFHNKNHNPQFKRNIKVTISVLQEDGDQDFLNSQQIINHYKSHTEKKNGNHGHKTT